MSEQTKPIDAANMSAEEVVEVLKNGPVQNQKETISWKDKFKNLFNRQKKTSVETLDPALEQTIGYLKGEQPSPANRYKYEGEPLNSSQNPKQNSKAA